MQTLESHIEHRAGCDADDRDWCAYPDCTSYGHYACPDCTREDKVLGLTHAPLWCGDHLDSSGYCPFHLGERLVGKVEEGGKV